MIRTNRIYRNDNHIPIRGIADDLFHRTFIKWVILNSVFKICAKIKITALQWRRPDGGDRFDGSHPG